MSTDEPSLTTTLTKTESSVNFHYIYAVILLTLAIVIIALFIVICRVKLKKVCRRRRETTETRNKIDSHGEEGEDNRSLEERLPPLYEAILETKTFRHHKYPCTKTMPNQQRIAEEPIYMTKLLLSDYITAL
ncbi:hypothetical protein Btru_009245 [Bulinus truncatus]|nr:hypothetical protein Btru_009245 [Bulinus truncatus]